MALPGKSIASMFTMPNEITVAAANFNFDFSLMKVEAPKEFHGVRDALSQHRRSEAEDGKPHVTARRLGALFEALVPPIPHLITAYGKRVSYICSQLTEELPRQEKTGIFTTQAGPDGTNIWAAATSGKGALAVHLLACMLSRIWKSHEATSLWVELIERRRQEITRSLERASATEVAAFMAARQTFNRQQLATWDSSARAWLQTADAARRRQHTQLTLIINNVDLPVNSSPDPYESVMQAWKSALRAMERLVQGIPQQTRDGAVLLGISAWHLYPDMEVLGDEITPVQQSDELMNHGLLTVPAQKVNVDREGVFWSLPLSRMRYYSPPIVTERRLSSDTSRISMEDLQIIVLGIVISGWGSECPDEERGCKFIISLARLVDKPVPWLELLSDAAQTLINSRGVEKKHLSKLFHMGMRRCHSFLTNSNMAVPPFFGLSSCTCLLGILDGMDNMIAFMRDIAQHIQAEDLIIRYRPPGRNSSYDPFKSPQYECASACPQTRTSKKRTRGDVLSEPKGHCRWIPLSKEQDTPVGTATIGNLIGCATLDEPELDLCSCKGSSDLQCLCESEGFQCTFLCHPDGVGCSNQGLSWLKCAAGCPGKGECSSCFQTLTRRIVEEKAEDCFFIRFADLETYSESQFTLRKPLESEPTIYDFLLGDETSIAIFRRYGSITPRFRNGKYEYTATIDDIEAVIGSPGVSGSNLSEYLRNWWHKSTKSPLCGHLQRSFEALVFASSLYKHMIEATISIEVVSLPLYEVLWTETGSKPNRELARPFACIGMFESGEFDLDPSALQGVIALSAGDSIYVASALLTDPTADTSQIPVQRVFGNLGRSEMALLIPPSDPRLEPFDPHSWRMVNHESFDGQFLDSFAATSLHLSFTDFEMPVDIGQRGLRDTRVILIESVISINHRGKYIGDLDVLSMFNSRNFTVQHSCRDSRAIQPKDLPTRLVSIDNWEELLDFPTSKAIFRASGNWQARMAGAAASMQSNKRTVVLPYKPCLGCMQYWCERGDVDVLIS